MAAIAIAINQADAEEVIGDQVFLRSGIKPGTRVRLHSSSWVAVISQEGIDCDCGKAVLCPLNPQRPRGY